MKPEMLTLAAEYNFPLVSSIYRFLSSKFDGNTWPLFEEFRELDLAQQLRFFDLFSSYLEEVIENSRQRKRGLI